MLHSYFGSIISKDYSILKLPSNNYLYDVSFYHSEKLQSTKTVGEIMYRKGRFYHSEKLQSTKTTINGYDCTF